MTPKPKAVRKFTGHENEQPLSALKKIIDSEMQGENNLRNEKKNPTVYSVIHLFKKKNYINLK